MPASTPTAARPAPASLARRAATAVGPPATPAWRVGIWSARVAALMALVAISGSHSSLAGAPVVSSGAFVLAVIATVVALAVIGRAAVSEASSSGRLLAASAAAVVAASAVAVVVAGGWIAEIAVVAAAVWAALSLIDRPKSGGQRGPTDHRSGHRDHRTTPAGSAGRLAA